MMEAVRGRDGYRSPCILFPGESHQAGHWLLQEAVSFPLPQSRRL